MNNNLPLGVITIVSGELKGTQYFIADGQTMVIGRSKDSGIVLPHSYSHVSRHHCTIAYDGINKNFYVIDTSSTGVYNSTGHHLKSQGYVGDGTILWIGNHECMIQLSVLTDYEVDHSPAGGGSSDRYSSGSSYASGNSNYDGPSKGRRDSSRGRRLKKENKALTTTVILATLIIVGGIAGGLIYKMNSAVNDMQQAFIPTGGLYRDDKPVESAEISSEEQEERTRYNEDYEENQNSEDTQLLVNKATEFYYYTKLTQEEKDIYDCIYKLAHNPTDANYSVEYHSSISPQSTEFNDMVKKVEYCVNYDHPETFWFYNGCRTSLMYESIDNDVYFKFTNVYTDFQKDMEDFNSAANIFLSEIDRSKSQAEIALDIHNKLIDLVTYDYDAIDDAHGRDAAHTAFGALVRNDSNVANFAVCDGYSQAYVYLLQQVGIKAVVLAGFAGFDENNLGGHAWSAVCLDGEWYEVDSTWDDFGNYIDGYSDLGSEEKKAMDEIASDKEYVEKCEHVLYNVTTDQMTNYEMDGDYSITTSNGYEFTYDISSMHIRATTDSGLYQDGMVMELAPIATGTKYRYH